MDWNMFRTSCSEHVLGLHVQNMFRTWAIARTCIVHAYQFRRYKNRRYINRAYENCHLKTVVSVVTRLTTLRNLTRLVGITNAQIHDNLQGTLHDHIDTANVKNEVRCFSQWHTIR